MGELGLNKIFGALLAVALVVMGLREVATMVFGGGHHGDHHYESMNDWAEASFHGYRIELADTGGTGPIVEEIYDLGLLLASADVSRGERSFKAKCASCHTIEQGGADGTGPNLYGRLGNTKQGVAGFAYSGALSNTEGDWSFANMDNWLKSPSKYARGTSMGFAGLNRDDERANVLAYLASYSPDAPAFPEPLPAVDETVAEDAAETVTEAAEETVGEVEGAETLAEDDEATVEAVVEEATEDAADLVETVVETGEAVVEDAGEAVDAAVETVEDAVEDAATSDEN